MSIRVFLVEDDPVIAIDLENSLAEAGFEIAHTAASVRGALRALPAIECDIAVLDVNLRGESVEPVALALRDRGIPYLFATGYGSDAIPPGIHRCPRGAEAR